MGDPRPHADVTPDAPAAAQAAERRWGRYVIRLEPSRLGWFYPAAPWVMNSSLGPLGMFVIDAEWRAPYSTDSVFYPSPDGGHPP
jgi:hypothetical protein